MSSPAKPEPSPDLRTFATLLADLASPEKKFPPASDLDGLADDIATLSYESALKTHARHQAPPDPPQRASQAPASTGKLTIVEVQQLDEERVPPPKATSPSPDAVTRKSASVTVRLTRSEELQLRRRAAEAGMTISAYLRSCAFEVETLRAQVKQTIAELRQPEAPREPRRTHFSRLFPWRKPAP